MRYAISLGLWLFCMSQLSWAGLFTDDEAHRKITALQQQNEQLKSQNQALEAKLNTVENLVRGQGADLLSQLEALRSELIKLRGQSEESQHGVDGVQKRQRELFTDLDGRLRKLEQAVMGANSVGPDDTASNAPPATKAGVAGAAASSDPAAETKAYESAFNLFRNRSYPAAISAFQNFIQTYPQSTFASSAQYWIGNAYFAMKDYKNAIANQQKLLSVYPSSQKAPDALLNIASAQSELGENTAAKKTLADLVKKHPATPAAELAKKRLATLK